MRHNTQTVRLLNRVAQNAEMGKHAARHLADAARDAPLKRALTRQADGYQDLQNRANAMLAVGGLAPEGQSPLAKLSAQWGVAAEAGRDAGAHNVARMVIRGSHAGQKSLRRALAESPDANPGAAALARRLYDAETAWAAQMREFL